MNIGIIGCGHMGSAIAKSLVSAGVFCVVSNPVKPHVKTGKFLKWTKDNCEAAKNAGVIILATRPGMVQEILAEIKPVLRENQIIISIAAGIPLKKLHSCSGGQKVVRVMPNLPAQVSQGMSTYICEKSLSKQEKSMVSKLLGSFGKAVEVKNESMIDMATAVCGGGPAYVAAFLQSAAAALMSSGFSKEDARIAAIQTVLGSAKYIQETGVDFDELKKAVQTKGGTTEAGFKVLKKKKWQATLKKAFEVGYFRAKN
jgi:pyrroline-5-carboxylate reductase